MEPFEPKSCYPKLDIMRMFGPPKVNISESSHISRGRTVNPRAMRFFGYSSAKQYLFAWYNFFDVIYKVSKTKINFFVFQLHSILYFKPFLRKWLGLAIWFLNTNRNGTIPYGGPNFLNIDFRNTTFWLIWLQFFLRILDRFYRVVCRYQDGVCRAKPLARRKNSWLNHNSPVYYRESGSPIRDVFRTNTSLWQTKTPPAPVLIKLFINITTHNWL